MVPKRGEVVEYRHNGEWVTGEVTGVVVMLTVARGDDEYGSSSLTCDWRRRPGVSADMTMREYQQLAERTARKDGDVELRKVVALLGLGGEIGEVLDLEKKSRGHGHPLDIGKLRKEIGDVLWYVSELASAYGISLGAIAAENIEKLRERYPNGFSTEASMARVDTASDDDGG